METFYLGGLGPKYKKIIIFDVETTGFNPIIDELLEIAMIVLTLDDVGNVIKKEELDELIQLAPGKTIPDEIVQLTKITNDLLIQKGSNPLKVFKQVSSFMVGQEELALLAYNASFDLQFLFAFFKKMKMEHILNLSHIDYYDCLTMYKDRAPYPHKLQDAINFYGLKEEVKNSHRALDDARATLVLFQTMMNQCDDGLNYRNLFGYNPKYPRRHHPIHKIKFRPQAYGASKKIYK